MNTYLWFAILASTLIYAYVYGNKRGYNRALKDVIDASVLHSEKPAKDK